MHNCNEAELVPTENNEPHLTTIIAAASALIGAIDLMNPPSAFAYTTRVPMLIDALRSAIPLRTSFAISQITWVPPESWVRRISTFHKPSRARHTESRTLANLFTFVVDGKYALTVYPSGEMPDEPGGF